MRPTIYAGSHTRRVSEYVLTGWASPASELFVFWSLKFKPSSEIPNKISVYAIMDAKHFE